MRHIDIAKGIGIICIIAGHLGVPAISSVVFTFHVPLFLIISGWFFKPASSTRDTVVKYTRHLLMPYIYCMVACMLGKGIVHVLTKGPAGSWDAIAQQFISALFGSGSLRSPILGIPPFGATWFLLALFWSFLMLNGIAKQKWAFLLVVCTFAAGVATRGWWLPFSLQAGMCSLLFVYIGYVANAKLAKGLLNKGIVPHWLAAASLCVWALAYFLDRGGMSVVRCYFTCIPVDCIGAVAGTLVVVWFSRILERMPILSSALELLGRHSLAAMCFHLFDLNVIPWTDVLRILGFAGNAVHSWKAVLLLLALKLVWAYLGIGMIVAVKRVQMTKGTRQAEENKHRIRYFDIAKGIAILLVVATHQAMVDPVFRKLVFSFHMPFFFLVNAIFIGKTYNVGRTFKRSIITLVLPYAVVGLLQVALVGLLTPVETKAAMLKRFQTMLVGMSFTGSILQQFDSVSFVWFVACLFVARNIYVACRRLTAGQPPYVQYALPLALGACGWYLGTKKWFMPWSADVALFVQAFMLIGDECRKRGVFGRRLGLSVVVIMAAIWISLALGGYQIELATRSYPGGMVCVIPACLGSFLLIFASEHIDATLAKSHDWIPAFLAWLGNNSMVILAAHCLRRLWSFWSGGNGDFTTTMPWGANACLEIVFCIALCFVFTRADALIKEVLKGSHRHQLEPALR